MTIDEILHSMECFMESDKRTMNNQDTDDAWIFETVHKWYQALKELECDDCISREQAIKSAECIIESNSVMKTLCILRMLKELPSVTPTERTGYWIAVYQGDEIINYRCSECEFGNTFGKGTYRMNYCPNCGCRMFEPQESEGEE